MGNGQKGHWIEQRNKTGKQQEIKVKEGNQEDRQRTKRRKRQKG
jgi:hypothetical protein